MLPQSSRRPGCRFPQIRRDPARKVYITARNLLGYEQLRTNDRGVKRKLENFSCIFNPTGTSLAVKSLVAERAARLQNSDFQGGGKRALAYHQGVCLHNLGLQSRSKLFDQVRVITVVYRDRNLGLELS